MRYALYFAPPADHPLALLAAHWLGRDAWTDQPLDRPAVPGHDGTKSDAITAFPRRYGFHGTLKAPFALADGRTEAELAAAVEAFAQTQQSFECPLSVAALGRFIALRPASPNEPLAQLAATCVEHFERFRAPLDEAELKRRRAGDLTPRQDALLTRYGYPYVMDEFRFHMTLTGPIEDEAERAGVRDALADLFAPLLSNPLRIDAVALFIEPERGIPFRALRRFVFPT